MADSDCPIQSAETPPPIPALRPTPRWRWWIHLVLIGVYPALGQLLRLGGHQTSRGPALSNTASGLLRFSGLELLVFATFFTAAWAISRASREQLMLPWRPGWWVAPLGVAYSIGLRIGIAIVVVGATIVVAATRMMTLERVQEYAKTNRPDVDVIVSMSAMRDNPVYYWLAITLISFVVAGLREEMWRAGTLAAMRALWPRIFDSRRGQLLAVALIAIAFGFMHIRMGILAAIFAGILGLFLGVIIVVHRSIWPAVIAHGFFDATSMALLPWAVDKIRQFH